MKKALSMLLVLALALAIFALPAAAETHDHDGCTACAEEIQPRVVNYNCPRCGLPCTYLGNHTYKCYECNRYYYDD